MLLPFDTPITDADTGISITGFTLGTTLAGLKDGRPGAITRLFWPAGAQAIDTTADISVAFTRPCNPRVFGAASIVGLPPGLKVRVGWQATQGGPYTAHERDATIVRNLSGSDIIYMAWPAGLGLAWGVRLTFFNDVSGAVAVAEEAPVDIGELWASDALDLDVETSGSMETAEGTVTELSLSGQPYDAIQPPRRSYTISGSWEHAEKALTDPISIERVRMLLARNPRTFFCLYETPEAEVAQLAMYAKVTGNQSGLKDTSRLFESDWRFEELR